LAEEIDLQATKGEIDKAKVFELASKKSDGTAIVINVNRGRNPENWKERTMGSPAAEKDSSL